MPIYTKKGDKGTTRVFNKTKATISKSDPLIRAIGGIDETNTFLGLAASFSEDTGLKDFLVQIQKDLFKIGSILAGAKLRLSPSRITSLERSIDKMQGSLPPLKNFILPGGSRVGATLHTARVVARRAERDLSALTKPPVVIQKYLNRLSDFLFVLARHTNHKMGSPEVLWKASKK